VKNIRVKSYYTIMGAGQMRRMDDGRKSMDEENIRDKSDQARNFASGNDARNHPGDHTEGHGGDHPVNHVRNHQTGTKNNILDRHKIIEDFLTWANRTPKYISNRAICEYLFRNQTINRTELQTLRDYFILTQNLPRKYFRSFFSN